MPKFISCSVDDPDDGTPYDFTMAIVASARVTEGLDIIIGTCLGEPLIVFGSVADTTVCGDSDDPDDYENYLIPTGIDSEATPGVDVDKIAIALINLGNDILAKKGYEPPTQENKKYLH